MLYRAQGGRCALCLRPFSVDDMAVDHEHQLALAHGHEAGRYCEAEVRGLLCRGCNSWLSGFRDDSTFLSRAARYAARRRDG